MNYPKRLFKEFITGILNGFVLGGISTMAVYIWQKDINLSFVVGFSMASVIVVAATLGALYPILLKKMDIDPAVATGPFITTSNDVIGLLIYLSIAKFSL